jgi:hypothetical protein
LSDDPDSVVRHGLVAVRALARSGASDHVRCRIDTTLVLGMLIDGRHQRTIGLADDGLTVRTLDKRLLPHELVWAELRSLEDASEKGPRRLFP